jgi:hypothetical protein
MYGKYEMQSENAKCNIRNFYGGNRTEAGRRPVPSTFQPCTREGSKDTTA